MNYLIVSCVFPPEPVVSARTSSDLAEELFKNGHQVRVLTSFPNRPAGKLYAGYQRRLWAHDTSFPNYDVLRCFSIFSPESRLLSRFLENLSFGLLSGAAVLFSEKPDVVYANTWPIFAQGILALACRIRGIPLVISVQDIYPETLITQGRARKFHPLYQRPLRWLDQKIGQSCEALVVISEPFRQIYTQDRGLAARTVYLIPNWVDPCQMRMTAGTGTLRDTDDIPADAFLVVYAGNISFASGLDRVIQAFENLAANSSIYLLIAGEGGMLADCKVLAEKIHNPRILFHTPWLESETMALLASASLFILPTQDAQSQFSVPSKLILYMLAGRPILACAGEHSEVARVIHRAECGWTIPACDPETIAQKLVQLSQCSAAELETYGKRAKEYAEQEMTKKANLPKLVKLLNSVASGETRADLKNRS